MIEALEAIVIARQLDETICGKTVTTVLVGHTPHKFAWFSAPAPLYESLLTGKSVGGCSAVGGYVVIDIGDMMLVLGDGVNVRYYPPGGSLPPKHQLLLGFDDESCLICSVRMYGAMMLFGGDVTGSNFSPYYQSARTKPQVMSDAFTREYFMSLASDPNVPNKSAKAFLATEQRIPGLGNGVLQDILFNARIHPKTKVEKLTGEELETLYDSVVSTMRQMLAQGGRNSETDIYGVAGGYVPFLSKDTAGRDCVRCGDVIIKENYMGGSIYYCPTCQPRK